MIKTIIAASAFAGLAMLSFGAEAMPADTGSNDAGIVLVSGGCGPDGHRGPYGGCQPNARPYFAPRPRYEPRPYFAPRPRCFIRPTPYGPQRVCR